MTLTVSVIIPTYNRPESLRQALTGLAAQTRPPDEILVVDQSRGADGRPLNQAAAVGRFPRVRYFYQEEPNAQTARNRAIREATGDVLILLDDDVRVGETFVENHLLNYEEDPSLDGVSGQVLSPGEAPTAELPATFSWRPTGWMWLPLNYAMRTPVINWPSCNGSVRAAVARAVGGFDEQFARTYWDDCDFSWRLHLAGARIVFDPRASLVHLKEPAGGKRPQGAGEYLFADEEYWGTLFYFWRKHFGLWPVRRHVWWFVRRLICRRQLVGRPRWLAANLRRVAHR